MRDSALQEAALSSATPGLQLRVVVATSFEIGRRVVIAGAAAWTIQLLYLLSNAGIGFPALILLLGSGALVACAGIVWRMRGRNRARVVIAWTAAAIAACACCAIFVNRQGAWNPLLQARFAASRGAFDAAIAAELPELPAWIGAYRVEHIDVIEGERHFLTGGCGVIDRCGFAYLPQPLALPRSKTRLTHLSGSWYLLYDVF